MALLVRQRSVSCGRLSILAFISNTGLMSVTPFRRWLAHTHTHAGNYQLLPLRIRGKGNLKKKGNTDDQTAKYDLADWHFPPFTRDGLIILITALHVYNSIMYR